MNLKIEFVAQLVACRLDAVADNYISCIDNRVVTHRLCEDALVDGYIHSLALDKCVGFCETIHDDNVGTLRSAVEGDGILLNDAMWLKTALLHEVGYYMLSHPLFGCQHEVGVAQ